MELTEQQLIMGLAGRIREAQPIVTDPEAADLIQRQIATQPDALYLLSQAVLVQEDALNAAQARIAELTQQLKQREEPPASAPSGGFMSNLFGRGKAAPQPDAPSFGRAAVAAGSPLTQRQPTAGGGFLKTAAAAAAGVAGGALVMQGLSSAFDGGETGQPHALGSFADEQDADDEDDF
ncbi:DUF2076 domain-containing protein [Mycolicibacterium sp. CH28]|uniref:DUF2076 domain-containing protein n=1 Tax=Mycolicibacterium sp. CH28 TaxID=2512237 RepID=UPI0010806F87|nr:DUF2076 family protein [Mycolicibacterium sp. CH28]TGD88410.1 DUF2076 domain-containing protein [Mycolicibacterium sp. CH28]